MTRIRRIIAAFLIALLPLTVSSAPAAEEIIPPQWPVPDYVQWLLEVASGEVGYTEEEHGPNTANGQAIRTASGVRNFSAGVWIRWISGTVLPF